MEQEYTYRLIGENYHLFWGEDSFAKFDGDVVIEEMEGIVEKLNEGSPFDGYCRFVG